ncbi:glucose 1-dehydrogenase [Bosea sp. LjRoot9]|uniref:SDR family NAD(P)-dependent oxidoreductase n=1 Tax=Bosea sp. LjRoot9 TaxID=3342341 RepID=UPI003ECC7219
MAGTPVAVVTGGADGIGFAVAERFAQAGCTVVIADLDGSKAAAKAAAIGLGHQGPGHQGLAMEVADESSVTSGIAAILARHGRIDMLVNNAGIADTHKPTVDQDHLAFERIVRVNLQGVFAVSREVGRGMLAQGSGAIVNLSSIAGLSGLPRRNAYGAAKAGVAAMTRSMAVEWAGRGIRVNAVAPGYVRTALVAELIASGRVDQARLQRRTPMGRLAEPAEIAEAVWFLCSPAASYITGVVLSVDGGWMAFGDSGDAWTSMQD